MADKVSQRVEKALTVILEEMSVNELDAGERAAVEHSCQSIHAKFGGEGPEEIYPEEDGQTVYDELEELIEEWRDIQDRCDLPRSGLTGEGHVAKSCADDLSEVIDYE